jgi:diadenosine tetraphosphatase ApaH/serine/threonine PP2A family protein phosphatase
VKTGVVSDVHSNIEALQAVLARLRDIGVEQVLCCGDIVGYGPDPRACIAAVRELVGPVVAGNHDWGVLGRTPATSFNFTARAAIRWTATEARGEDRAYLASLPLTLSHPPFFLVHCAPSDPEGWGYVLSPTEAEAELAACDEPVCLLGHSHQPLVVEKEPGEPARILVGERFTIRPGARYLINAGSVGQPRDGDPRASCLVVDSETDEAGFERVEYDIPAVQRKIVSAGLPSFLAERLATGR